MPKFSTNEAPWAEYNCIIREVYIGGEITTVGRCSFFNCFNLENVDLPSTLEAIGEYAFASCTSLTSIYIPASVTFIADNAFNDSGTEG